MRQFVLLAVVLIVILIFVTVAKGDDDWSRKADKILKEVEEQKIAIQIKQAVIKKFEGCLLKELWYQEKYRAWQKEDLQAGLAWTKQLRRSADDDNLLSAEQKRDWYRLLEKIDTRAMERWEKSIPSKHQTIMDELMFHYPSGRFGFLGDDAEKAWKLLEKIKATIGQ